MATVTRGTDHYVSWPDGRVYYHKVGFGEPLALLHAVGSSGWTWRHVISSLAQHFTCYNIDMPGFDHSDVPTRKYSVEEYARVILEVLDKAGVKETSFLASHSGAIVAVCIAATYPQRVKRLVTDGLPYWDKERGKAYWENSITPRLTDKTSYDLPVPPMTTWEETVRNNPNADRERWEKSEEIKRKSRYWIRLSYEAITSFDVEATGPRVRAPTLLIYGDAENARYRGDRATAGIKGSILKVLPGSPGEAHEHKREEFMKLALPFLLGQPLKG